MAKYKKTHRSRLPRKRGWNYAQPGSYFITACTKNRRHFFGEIINGEMRLNKIGMITKQCWEEIPEHYTNVVLGEFQVMPDHIHGIIIIVYAVGPGHAPTPTGHAPTLKAARRHAPTIGNMVGSFKSAVTRLADVINPEFVWQPRFHDRIIRDEKSFARISEYIRNNPANWDGSS